MTGDSIETFSISLEEAPLRLDKLLVLRFPQYSRTYFQFLIESNCVLVNGKQLKKREKIAPTDEVEVCFLLTPEIAIQAEPIPLDILYEDEDIIAINKPAQMVVHPAPGHSQGTFVNALLHHCKTLNAQDPLRPGIVHRLDKDTTGVLIAAKTAFAHARLVALFSERKVKKKYVCICVGVPKEGLISAPIARHSVHRQQMTVCPIRGKEAKTLVRVLSKNTAHSYVELELITGRTHQIRVHMKHLNTPVLGDPLYGSEHVNKKYNVHRQLLHAMSISFPHPVHENEVTIQAPLACDFAQFIEKNFA